MNETPTAEASATGDASDAAHDRRLRTAAKVGLALQWIAQMSMAMLLLTSP